MEVAGKRADEFRRLVERQRGQRLAQLVARRVGVPLPPSLDDLDSARTCSTTSSSSWPCWRTSVCPRRAPTRRTSARRSASDPLRCAPSEWSSGRTSAAGRDVGSHRSMVLPGDYAGVSGVGSAAARGRAGAVAAITGSGRTGGSGRRSVWQAGARVRRPSPSCRCRFLPAAAAAVLLLSACGGQVGNAAIVERDRDRSGRICWPRPSRSPACRAARWPPIDWTTDQLTLTNRALLSREVQHEILTGAGLGVTATPEQLSGLEQQLSAGQPVRDSCEATPDTFAERVGDVLSFERCSQLPVASGDGHPGTGRRRRRDPVRDPGRGPRCLQPVSDRPRVDDRRIRRTRWRVGHRDPARPGHHHPGRSVLGTGRHLLPAARPTTVGPTSPRSRPTGSATRVSTRRRRASCTPQDFSTLGALLLSQQLRVIGRCRADRRRESAVRGVGRSVAAGGRAVVARPGPPPATSRR